MNKCLNDHIKEDWHSFEVACAEIRKNYEKYGQIVLDYELEGEDEQLEKVLKEEDKKIRFVKLIKYWDSKYQLVLRTIDDLKKIPEFKKESPIFVDVCGDNITVSTELFQQLLSMKKSEFETISIRVKDASFKIMVVDGNHPYIYIEG